MPMSFQQRVTLLLKSHKIFVPPHVAPTFTRALETFIRTEAEKYRTATQATLAEETCLNAGLHQAASDKVVCAGCAQAFRDMAEGINPDAPLKEGDL